MKQVLIIGCGTIGKLVADLYRKEGCEVAALSRNEDKGKELADLGITPIIGNLDFPAQLPALPTRDAILFYFAPPPGGGHIDPRVRNLCGKIRPGEEPRKIIYISTSGVYGDHGGDTVTEETPAEPATARGKRRLDAEQTLLDWGAAHKVPVVILRVTGIYGPGKLPYMQLQQGLPVLKDELGAITNRIHSTDLARVCLAAADRGDAGDIFNVNDGHPTTMTSYFLAVADALGLPKPRQIGWEEAKQILPPLMLSYFSESRKVDNRKMLDKLGIKLLYPTLEEGLRATIETERRNKLPKDEGPS